MHLRWKMNAPLCAFHVPERIAGNLSESIAFHRKFIFVVDFALRVYRTRGDERFAICILQSLLQTGHDDPVVHRNLGYLYSKNAERLLQRSTGRAVSAAGDLANQLRGKLFGMEIHRAQAQVVAQLHASKPKPLRSDCLAEPKCRILKEFFDLIRHGNPLPEPTI